MHIPNMIDLGHLPARQPGAGEGMLYVGQLEEQKGILTLLDAAAYVPRIPITIVGDGPLYDTIRDRIAKEGMTHVTMTGRLSLDEVYAHMQRARAMIVPSAGYDTFPTVALEAGALGRPVIASRIGGLPEIIVDEQTGILVTPQQPHALAEAMRSLAQHSDRAEQLGSAAVHHIRALVDPARHIQRLLAVYQERMRRSQ